MKLNFNFLVLFSLLAVAQGFTLKQSEHTAQGEVEKLQQEQNGVRTDYGQAIGDALLGILQSLPADMPIALVRTVNLTALSDLLNLDPSLRLDGKLNIKEIHALDLPQATVPVATLIVNGILNAIPISVRITNPTARLRIDFDIDARGAGGHLIVGQGSYMLALNLTVGVDATLKAKLGNPVLMTMTEFDYLVGDLENMQVTVQGQHEWGNVEFGEDVKRNLAEHTKRAIIDMEKITHGKFAPVIPPAFDWLKLTFDDLLNLLNPKP